MTKIRAILLAAATLAVGTLVTLSSALQTTLTNEGVTCAQAKQAGRSIEGRRATYFGAIAVGFNPPDVVTWNGVDYPLGDCAGGKCVITSDGCTQQAAGGTGGTEPMPLITYTYELSSALGGWRMYKLNAPDKLGKAWWALAQANPSQFRFWRSYKDAGADCVAAGFSAAQCRNLASEVNPCWKRTSDGGVCHRGRLYNLPDSGGKDTCTPGAGWVPFPCESPQPDIEAAADGGFN